MPRMDCSNSSWEDMDFRTSAAARLVGYSIGEFKLSGCTLTYFFILSLEVGIGSCRAKEGLTVPFPDMSSDLVDLMTAT